MVKNYVTSSLSKLSIKGKFRGQKYQSTREATLYLFYMLKYLGLGKTNKLKYLYNLYSVLLQVFATVFIPFSFNFSCAINYNKMTTSQFLTSLRAGINSLGLPFKNLAIILLLKRLEQALDVMDILDACCHRKDEHEKIRQCVIFGKRLAMIYIIVYALYLAITLAISIFMVQPPYSLFIPMIVWQNSILEFFIQTSFEFLIMFIAVSYHAIDDVYALIYIYVIRTHMQILVERVRRLGTDISTGKDNHYEQLINCVVDHQNLLRLVNIVSPVISVTMFAQFVITAAVLGTTLINILVFGDFSTQIASAVFFLAVSFQTFPCCYQASCLLEESQQLSTAIFHSEWFNKDFRYRKMMIFFMMRSETPITLTAMKLFPITLSTSLGIVQYSFSFFTLIKTMDFGQNFKH